MARSAAPSGSPEPLVTTTTALFATSNGLRPPPAADLPLAPMELAPRFQVQAVQWGNHKRFVVRDMATDTTIAIRTTRQIADSDLIRLKMADLSGEGLPPESRQLRTETPSGARERQCGRCRQLFPADPDLDPTGMQDWWLCDPCHHKLFGTHVATLSAQPT